MTVAEMPDVLCGGPAYRPILTDANRLLTSDWCIRTIKIPTMTRDGLEYVEFPNTEAGREEMRLWKLKMRVRLEGKADDE